MAKRRLDFFFDSGSTLYRQAFKSYKRTTMNIRVIQPTVGTIACFATRTSYVRGYQNILFREIGFWNGQCRNHVRGDTFRLFSSNDQQQDTFSADDTNEFATSYHAPVMWRECIDALLQDSRPTSRQGTQDKENQDHRALIFVDGTLGGGGHSAALLKRLEPGDIVFGCDVDPEALKTASKRLDAYMPRAGDESQNNPIFVPVQSNFCDLAAALPHVIHPQTQQPIFEDPTAGGLVDGILLDLGVSSHQIDTPERGFAFMKDGPLDMRMASNAGLTAADICNEFDVTELQRILSVHGDEPRAKTIAKAIVTNRPLKTTGQLMEAVASVTPKFVKQSKRRGLTATLARVFQSLRIAVNNEDAALEKALLEMSPSLLRPGGRLVVMSYHSKEDRATKRIMRDGTMRKVSYKDERDIYGNYIGPPKPFKPIGKRQKATEEEINANPRARSATLRVAQRLDNL